MTSQPHERIPQWTRGDRLGKARRTTGLGVREFAAQIGVSTKTISDAENDKRAVRRATLKAWALVTGVPLKWLETGEAPRPDDPDEGLRLLPRLDSNQEPFGYRFPQVRALFPVRPMFEPAVHAA